MNMLVSKRFVSRVLLRRFSNVGSLILSPSFQICEVLGKGKGLIATRDLLPGHVLFKEEPLLSASKELINSFSETEAETGVNGYVLAMFEKFYKTLDFVNQQKVVALYHLPTFGIAMMPEMEVYIKKNEWEDEKRKLFEKFALVCQLNCFAGDHSHRIYEKCSRMNHSCAPNCRIDFTGDRDAIDEDKYATCVIVSPIRTGDELTVSYGFNDAVDLKAQKYRRAYYSLINNFRCDCPRCTALGDDTRQFHCENDKCGGRHLVCQRNLVDTPYLLPCNLCSLVPSKEFGTKALEAEQQINEVFDTFLSGEEKKEVPAILDCHLRAESILCVKVCTTTSGEERSRYAAKLGRILDGLPLPPNSFHSTRYNLAAGAFNVTNLDGDLTLAKHYGQRGLRQARILYGRDAKTGEKFDDIEKILSDVMHRLPPPQPISTFTECMFCGESPALAEMTVRTCVGCSGAYCSARCQKAHWKIHRGRCRK